MLNKLLLKLEIFLKVLKVDSKAFAPSMLILIRSMRKQQRLTKRFMVLWLLQRSILFKLKMPYMAQLMKELWLWKRAALLLERSQASIK